MTMFFLGLLLAIVLAASRAAAGAVDP